MTAVERINSEMQKNHDDRYTEIVGQYVIDRCAAPEEEKKVTDKMTLKGAMEAVHELAKKRKNSNHFFFGPSVAVLTPGEVFGEVDRYFGFTTDEAAQWRAVGMTAPAVKAAPAGQGPARMALDLNDLW